MKPPIEQYSALVAPMSLDRRERGGGRSIAITAYKDGLRVDESSEALEGRIHRGGGGCGGGGGFLFG